MDVKPKTFAEMCARASGWDLALAGGEEQGGEHQQEQATHDTQKVSTQPSADATTDSEQTNAAADQAACEGNNNEQNFREAEDTAPALEGKDPTGQMEPELRNNDKVPDSNMTEAPNNDNQLSNTALDNNETLQKQGKPSDATEEKVTHQISTKSTPHSEDTMEEVPGNRQASTDEQAETVTLATGETDSADAKQTKQDTAAMAEENHRNEQRGSDPTATPAIPRPAILDKVKPVSPTDQPKITKPKKGKKANDVENSGADATMDAEAADTAAADERKRPAKKNKGSKTAAAKATTKANPKAKTKPATKPKSSPKRDGEKEKENKKQKKQSKKVTDKAANPEEHSKPKGKRARKEETEENADPAAAIEAPRRKHRQYEGLSKEEVARKQKISRKSSAYHVAFKKARKEGRDEETAKAEAKQA